MTSVAVNPGFQVPEVSRLDFAIAVHLDGEVQAGSHRIRGLQAGELGMVHRANAFRIDHLPVDLHLLRIVHGLSEQQSKASSIPFAPSMSLA